MSYDLENVKLKWEKYQSLCAKLKDENIDIFLEFMGERIIMCPSSLRESEHNCGPGGLVQHALDVALAMKSINTALKLEVPTSSILKVALFHEIGKIGDEENPWVVEQDSEWHREKLGQNYKYSESTQKMSISHRTLFLLQRFNIKLTQEEWIAIQISPGSHYEENRFYAGNETALGILLQKAKAFAIHQSTAKV